jgi:hypothetical protein
VTGSSSSSSGPDSSSDPAPSSDPASSSHPGAPRNPESSRSFCEGATWEGPDAADRAAAIAAAFDYRGDVTLRLENGETLQGYLSNRCERASEPHLDFFPSDGSPQRRILYRGVKGIAFTGRDTASGKSWEAWVQRYEAKKAARMKGEDVGPIGLFPDAT